MSRADATSAITSDPFVRNFTGPMKAKAVSSPVSVPVNTRRGSGSRDQTGNDSGADRIVVMRMPAESLASICCVGMVVRPHARMAKVDTIGQLRERMNHSEHGEHREKHAPCSLCSPWFKCFTEPGESMRFSQTSRRRMNELREGVDRGRTGTDTFVMLEVDVHVRPVVLLHAFGPLRQRLSVVIQPVQSHVSPRGAGNWWRRKVVLVDDRHRDVL